MVLVAVLFVRPKATHCGIRFGSVLAQLPVVLGSSTKPVQHLCPAVRKARKDQRCVPLLGEFHVKPSDVTDRMAALLVVAPMVVLATMSSRVRLNVVAPRVRPTQPCNSVAPSQLANPKPWAALSLMLVLAVAAVAAIMPLSSKAFDE